MRGAGIFRSIRYFSCAVVKTPGYVGVHGPTDLARSEAPLTPGTAPGVLPYPQKDGLVGFPDSSGSSAVPYPPP